MTILKLAVEFVPRISHTKKRAIAFLRGDSDLDAGSEFDSVVGLPLGKKLMHRMTLWIGGHSDMKGKFHRFRSKSTDPKYRECFAFIDIEEKIRLYGFTCHPDKDNPGFELIVLTTCAIKKEDKTDTAELDRVLKWMKHPETARDLKELYPDKPTESERKKK